MGDSNRASLEELQRASRSGALSAGAILEDGLARIAEREPVVGAWQYIGEDRARAAVRHADDWPLAAIPVGVKDIIDTADMPTECGSAILGGRRPEQDAWCVTKLRDLGAVVLGKTVTTEFAYFGPGRTRNPHNPAHTPGGSSSGSAAAVADYMVPIALGSQTAGSTTRPAAFCGVASLAVTVGSVPMDGVGRLSPSLDTLGLFARSARDLAVFHGALTDRPPAGPRAADELTVLCCDASEFTEIDPELADAYARLRAALSEHGATCVPFEVTPARRGLVADHCIVMAYEAARTLRFVDDHRGQISAPLAALLDDGAATARATYDAALERIGAQREQMAGLLGQADAVLLPAAPGPAPRGLASTGDPVLSRPWQAMGLPAAAMAGYRNAIGLPLGMQVVGAPGRDAELLQVAAAVEDVIRDG